MSGPSRRLSVNFTASEVVQSRRDLLRSLGWAGAGAAALAAGAARAQQCEPPAGSVAGSASGSLARPASFASPTSALRVRKSANKLSPAELDRLKKAYAEMRKLPASDPRSFAAQANVHCYYCGAHPSIEVHGSWRFFAFHRAYLHFHERILAKLVGDPAFALPYWDWASDRAVPAPYREAGSSLVDTTRGPGRNDGTAKVGDDLVGPSVVGNVLQGVSSVGFMGDAQSGGNLEFGPHGGVHIWVGGDMTQLNTAARDPLFYAHHNNIDRLWAVWLGQGGGRHNPDDAAFLGTSWKFADENGKWVTITAKDVLDPKGALHNTWNHDPGDPPGGFRLAAAGHGRAPKAMGKAAPELEHVRLSEAGQLPGKPHHVRGKLQDHHKRLLRDTAGHAFFLQMDGVEVPPSQSAIVRVYVNKPDATHATPTADPHFVGYVAVVAKTSAGGHGHVHRHNVSLRIPHALRKQLAEGSEMQATLVPVDHEGRPAPKINLRHGGIRALHHKRRHA